jgi:hypothetical protein
MRRLRPSHPAPTFRDDREAPLLIGHGMARASKGDLPDGESEKFPREGLDGDANHIMGTLRTTI